MLDSAADWLEGRFARLAASPKSAALALLAVSLAVFLPGVGALPLVEGREPAFVLGARAAAAGDLGPFWSLGAEAWLGAAPVAVLDAAGSLWAYRLASALAAVAAPSLLYWAVRPLLGREGALVAAILLLGSAALALQARAAVPDAPQLLATIAAMGLTIRLAVRPASSPGYAVPAFWVLTGLVFVLQGPVHAAALLAAGAITVAANERDLRALLHPAAFVVVVAAVAVWAAARPLSGDTFLAGAALAAGADPVEAPPGTYLLLLPLVVGPAATYLFVAAAWIGGGFDRAAVRIGLAWAVPAWLVAEFSASKLPYLIVPALPGIALLAAAAVDARGAVVTNWLRRLLSLSPLVTPPVLAVLLAVGFFAAEDRWPVAALPLLALPAIAGPVSWLYHQRGRLVAATLTSTLSAVLLIVTLTGVLAPRVEAFRVGERAVAAAADVAACGMPEVVVSGYGAQTVSFYLGREVAALDATAAADWLAEGGCRVAAVERAQLVAFRGRADDLGLAVTDLERVRGLDVRQAELVEMHLFAEGSADP